MKTGQDDSHHELNRVKVKSHQQGQPAGCCQKGMPPSVNGWKDVKMKSYIAEKPSPPSRGLMGQHWSDTGRLMPIPIFAQLHSVKSLWMFQQRHGDSEDSNLWHAKA